AATSASRGVDPAATSSSTSQASWPARTEPPPKSDPVAMRTPARLAAATAAYAPSLRFAIRRRPSSVVKRSMAVVLANVSHDAKTESVAAVERDGTAVGHRSADAARPQHAGLDETLGVLARDLPQNRRRIVATSDPVAATLHGQMAVAVDQTRHDHRPARIDHVRSR